jgi:prepilin-type N-terminal cleavage/methylation domain-containing protein
VGVAYLAVVFTMADLKKRHGFTLIELLVAISIIAILTIVSTAAYMTAQKRGRDTKRRGDLRSIQQALEQCYVLDGVYPSGITPGSALTCGSSQTVINQVPYDPKNDDTYAYEGMYSVAADRLSYCLCILLEKSGSGNATAEGSGGSCTYTSGADSNYQCANSQQ